MQWLVGIEGAGKQVRWALTEDLRVDRNTCGADVPSQTLACPANRARVLAHGMTA